MREGFELALASDLKAAEQRAAALEHQLEQSLERKRTAYQSLWDVSAYAGHLQIAVRALISEVRMRYDVPVEHPLDCQYMRQLEALMDRDLRWPLEEAHVRVRDRKAGTSRGEEVREEARRQDPSRFRLRGDLQG